MLKIIDVEQKSDEWLELRRTKITASSVATALRMNGDERYDEYINEKRTGERRFFGNSATRYGEMFEPIARKIFEHYEHVPVKEYGFVVNEDYPCLGVSPDGVLPDGNLLEIKCPYTRKITGDIKNDYWQQIQLQCSVMKAEYCHFLECDFKLEKLKKNSNLKYDLKRVLDKYLDSGELCGGIVFIGGDYLNNDCDKDWEREFRVFGPMWFPISLETCQGCMTWRHDDYFEDFIDSCEAFIKRGSTTVASNGCFWIYKLATCSCQKVETEPTWITTNYPRLYNVYLEFTSEESTVQECLF